MPLVSYRRRLSIPKESSIRSKIASEETTERVDGVNDVRGGDEVKSSENLDERKKEKKEREKGGKEKERNRARLNDGGSRIGSFDVEIIEFILLLVAPECASLSSAPTSNDAIGRGGCPFIFRKFIILRILFIMQLVIKCHISMGKKIKSRYMKPSRDDSEQRREMRRMLRFRTKYSSGICTGSNN